MTVSDLHLVVPGLLGPDRRRENLPEAQPFPELASLRKLLGRATCSGYAPRELETALFELCGLDPEDELPTAAVSRLGQGRSNDHRKAWMLMAPVHLRPDGDRVLLSDRPARDLLPGEREQVAARVSEHFREDGWVLEDGPDGFWYLGLPRRPSVKTRPLSEVAGRNIDGFLPAGPEGAWWRAALTEVQMLLHDSQSNDEREARGRLSVNGVWFWGGGELPDAPSCRFDAVLSDTALGRGLCRLCGARCSSLRAALEGEESGQVLGVVDDLLAPLLDSDHDAWVGRLCEMEGALFRPLLNALSTKQWDALSLYPLDGLVYRVRPRELRYFWRRACPLPESG